MHMTVSSVTKELSVLTTLSCSYMINTHTQTNINHSCHGKAGRSADTYLRLDRNSVNYFPFGTRGREVINNNLLDILGKFF